MRLSEKELRRIAQHVVSMLPDDFGDCERVFKLAMELKQWEEENGPPDDNVEGGGTLYRAERWRRRG